MLGNPFAGFGNRDQLRLTGFVLFLCRHFPGQLGITMSQADNGPHDDEAGFIEVELGGIRQPHVEGRLPLLDLLDHAGKPIVVNPGVVKVASATRPVKETNDEAGIIGRVRIKTILLFEDLKRAGLQRTLVPVIERPLVCLPVFRGLRLLNGLLFLHPIHVPFRIRVDAVDGARHAAHEEVVVDVELLPLKQGCHELGPTDDLLVACGGLVNLLHDPDPLKIDLGGVLLSCSFSRSIRALSAFTLLWNSSLHPLSFPFCFLLSSLICVWVLLRHSIIPPFHYFSLTKDAHTSISGLGTFCSPRYLVITLPPFDLIFCITKAA